MIKKNTPLKQVLEHGKSCTHRCGHCCTYGSGCLVGEDKKDIAKFLDIDENELEEKYLEVIEKFNTKLLRPKLKRKEGMPYGKCVFLTKDYGCSIHPVKPLQCKIGTCSEHGEQLALWFTLNFFVNPADPESIRQFAAYLKSGGKTLLGGELLEIVPDKQILKRILEYEDLKVDEYAKH